MLPIDSYLPYIVSTLKKQQTLVLQAQPGAGKSTAVPLALLEANLAQGKKVIMLEPRRVAAKSLAHYLASQLGEKVGERVGYQVRNEKRVSANTQLEIVTEGVLTRRLQSDPEIADIGVIIFDEFHERSIHADLALMLAFEVQQAYRDDLKLLVMSATIDTNHIANYLEGAPVISCPGRSHAVDIDYKPVTSRYLEQHVCAVISQEVQKTQGDVLVFLPGQGEIKRCIASAESILGDVDLLPLYGALPLAEQEKVLRPRQSKGKQRVIFATNIAETSLTIEGITCVIDSGLEKVLSYDVKSGLTRLDTVTISKASATQRAGRAGRVQAGRCVRLWSESVQQGLAEFQALEIARSDLANLALELSAWGITQFDDANWLDAPPEHHFAVACELNNALQLTDSNNKLTALGEHAQQLGVEPRFASMMLRSKGNEQKALACVLAALLSERDILLHGHSVDIAERVLAVIARLSGEKTAQIHRGALEQVLNLAKSFAAKIKVKLAFDANNLAALQQHLASLLFYAFPDRLAKARANHSQRYQLANGRGVTLADDDPLIGQNWLIVCDCDGKNKDGRIFIASALSESHALELTKSEATVHNHYQYNEKSGSIVGRSELRYRALVLKSDNLAHIPDDEFTRCASMIVQQQGLSLLNWTPKCDAWLARVQWLGQYDNAFAHISEQSLLAQLDKWLLPYISHIKTIKQLKALNIYDLLIANLDWQQQQTLDEQAPVHYTTPSDKQVVIRYDQHQGPTVSVILQEMFGQLESPRLAHNQVPLRFELLSPARRPIQTTSDLAHFWRNSYFDVAKDMRGRYPKHRWPEKPLEEKPGRSIKRKGQ